MYVYIRKNKYPNYKNKMSTYFNHLCKCMPVVHVNASIGSDVYHFFANSQSIVKKYHNFSRFSNSHCNTKDSSNDTAGMVILTTPPGW